MVVSHALPTSWSTTQSGSLTGNQTSDPLVCRPVLNPLSPTSQGSVDFSMSLCALSVLSENAVFCPYTHRIVWLGMKSEVVACFLLALHVLLWSGQRFCPADVSL